MLASQFMNKVVPVLPMGDHDAAKRFYVEMLGFAVDFEHQHEPGFPMYMGVQHGDLYLHLSEHARGHPGSEVYVFVDDIERWHRRFIDHDVAIESGPIDQPWGNREILIKDPFNNALRFSEIGASRTA